VAVPPKLVALVARSFAPLVAAMLVAPVVRADRTTDAEDLFRRAKGLIAQDKYVEACPLLEESYRLERARGTLLNLALCHEHVGKTSAAWGEFRRVEQEERASGAANESRIELARAHANELESRVSRLEIVVRPEARAAGLVIKVDGEVKGEPLWAGVPVDAGTRTVEASATNKKPVVIKVEVDDGGALVAVTIPILADAPIAAPVALAGGANLDELEHYASNRARRTSGFVVGGIGLVTLAVGGAFGVAAIVNDSDAKACSPCIRGSAEANASDRSTDRAFAFANVSNLTVPLGALGTLIGTYLVLSAGPIRRVAVAPVASARSGGLLMSGRW
jgi:hypothetical protein